MSKKKLLLLTSVLTTAVVVSVILWLVFSNSTDNQNDMVQSDIELIEPERVESPEGFDPNSLEIVPREESYEYNDQIISPDTVASNPDDYIDKEFTVRGWIVNPSQDLFLITSINSDEQKGLVLAKNGSIVFSEYTNPTSDYLKASTPVTLTGTFSINVESGVAEYTVVSLSQ